MHDAFDAEPLACLIKDEVLVKRAGCLEAANAGEFHRLKVTAQSDFGVGGKTLNRLINSHQITLRHFNVGIFQIPSVLQEHVLLCPQGNDNWQAHAREL